MPHIKTAISLQRSLFDELEALARELRLSRSRLFALAVEDYLLRRRNRRLLERIDAASTVAPTRSERTLQHHMRRHHRRMVEGEW